MIHPPPSAFSLRAWLLSGSLNVRRHWRLCSRSLVERSAPPPLSLLLLGILAGLLLAELGLVALLAWDLGKAMVELGSDGSWSCGAGCGVRHTLGVDIALLAWCPVAAGLFANLGADKP